MAKDRRRDTDKEDKLKNPLKSCGRFKTEKLFLILVILHIIDFISSVIYWNIGGFIEGNLIWNFFYNLGFGEWSWVIMEIFAIGYILSVWMIITTFKGSKWFLNSCLMFVIFMFSFVIITNPIFWQMNIRGML